ncbi:MAG: hypothetical protein AAFU53_00140 [Cyanobacteria bacterium J06632_3]
MVGLWRLNTKAADSTKYQENNNDYQESSNLRNGLCVVGFV